MGRSVADTALLLSAMAGPDPRVPIALPEPGATFRAALEHNTHGKRVAFSCDLGLFPVDAEVARVFHASLPTFESLGVGLEQAEPDLSKARDVFTTLRAWMFVARLREDYKNHRDMMKDTVRWNIEQGMQLEVSQLTAAQVQYAAVAEIIAEFFARFDFLLCPAAQVPPFPIEQEWVSEINGISLPTYLEWMGVCWAITVTGMSSDLCARGVYRRRFTDRDTNCRPTLARQRTTRFRLRLRAGERFR